MSRDESLYLADIQESCEKVLKYTAGMKYDVSIQLWPASQVQAQGRYYRNRSLILEINA